MESPPPLVLLAPRVTDDSVRIWKAAIEEGWSVQRLASWRAPENLQIQERDLVVYAEPLFAEAVTDQLDMILLEPPPDWLGSLPARFVQRRLAIGTLAEARQINTPTFVKPAEGKVFEARVYASAEHLPSADQVDDDLPVLMSEPVTWKLEVRCFVLERKVTTVSPYWREGQLAEAEDGSWPFIDDEENDAMNFARSIAEASDVELPPAFVLDIGITKERGWAVIEGNPCWGAGLYGCSARAALYTARRAIRHQSNLVQAERKWTSPRIRKRLLASKAPSPKDDRK